MDSAKEKISVGKLNLCFSRHQLNWKRDLSQFPNGNVSKLKMCHCCRYQNDLPKKIKSRGKEGHVTHEELVQTIKWKLAVSPVNSDIIFYNNQV